MTSVLDAERGYDPRRKLDVQDNAVYLTGTQALVRAIFDQLRRDAAARRNTAAFISGYPGSPLGSFDLEVARHQRLMKDLQVTHLPGHNEELAATSVYGTQMAQTFPDAVHDGVLGVWYGKGPGLDRAADAIRHGQYVGTAPEGGVLALVGDDPACKSSSIPNTSEHSLKDLGLPFLSPSSVADILELAPHGVALSRLSGLWTGVRIVTDVADGAASVPGTLAVPDIVVPGIRWNGVPFKPSLRGIPGPPWSIDIEAEIRGPRLEVARAYGYLNKLNRIVVDAARPRVAVVAVGHLLHETLSAMNGLGLDESALASAGVRLCHVRMPYPLDPRTIREFASGVERVIVVEEKRALVETAIREALYGEAHQPRIVGKHGSDGSVLIPPHGAIHTDDLTRPLRSELVASLEPGVLRELPARRTQLPVVGAVRAPYFCSGCPHNTSTKVPGGAVVGGGIGCHGITQFMDKEVVGNIATTTQMGGEGAQWFGIAPHVTASHTFQNLGDGTYFHSGQLAVQAAVAAKANITYKLLYNGAIAMTGGQDTAESNALAIPEVAEILLRQGVRRIIVTTDDRSRYRRVRLPRGAQVWDRSRVVEAQEALRDTGGVTVLIHDQRCAAENRRDRKRGRIPAPEQKVFINERICEGCGDCGAKSNCLSVEPVDTEFGRKTQVNQTSCNSDFSCLNGDCPSFVTVIPAATRGAAGKKPESVAGLLAADPPAPARPRAGETVIRMPGIGGTGVVTAAQIIGTAAMLAGREVAGMDQTGLSQKAGPVISDLRIGSSAADGHPRPTSKAFAESVDLLLGFDLLVAADAVTQQSLRPGHTVAVVSTTRVPTGAMVADVRVAYPDIREFQQSLEGLLGPGNVHWVDGGELAEQLIGDRSGANILLLGVAAQLGSLPMPVDALERAIELNGVAVDANLAAFRAGRWWVADRDRLLRAAGDGGRASASARPQTPAIPDEWVGAVPDRLKALVRRRAADLADYQNLGYAQRYARQVDSIAAAEARVSGDSFDLTESVARNLHKLMAYKDEYEVARLSLHPDAGGKIRDAFGPGARVYWNLHPPVFRALGMKRKLKLGAWFTPAFVTLYRMRGMRGTVLDPFGRTEVRRLERRLVAEYTGALSAVESVLAAANIERAVAMARLPEQVRGYEQLKLDSGRRVLDALAAARTGLGV